MTMARYRGTAQQPDRMVRGYKAAREFIPVNENKLRDMVRQGLVPPPRRLGARTLIWFESELLAAQRKLLARS